MVADSMRFTESDIRADVTTDTRVSPGEANQARIAGQIDELYAVAAEARAEAANANERISALDDYDMQDSVAVTFRVNSAVLSPEAKLNLDDFAQKVINARATQIEISGPQIRPVATRKTFVSVRERAESVVQYLAVTHKIPLRRFITPMGYGKTEAVADNSTASGRSQNRRVEVKMLLNRGITQQRSTTSAAKP